MMNQDDAEVVDATIEFEQALQNLVLQAFGKGARVEGEWTVALPVASAPDWTIEIRKHRAEQGAYSPEFIEE